MGPVEEASPGHNPDPTHPDLCGHTKATLSLEYVFLSDDARVLRAWSVQGQGHHDLLSD